MNIAARARNGIQVARALGGAVVVVVFAWPGGAAAGTATDNSAPFSASTNLDHRINYPRFLRFRVGAAAGVTLVTCDLTAQAASLGSGTDLACTGGDLGAGASTVHVVSNAGQVNVQVTTLGALLSGPNSVPFSEIKTASSDPALPAPVLPAIGGTSASVPVVLSAGTVTNRTATWTYTFDNAGLYPAGTYGGVNVNNGRVTYTASAP